MKTLNKLNILLALGAAATAFVACEDKQYTLDAPEAELMREITFECSETLPLAVGMDSTLTFTVGPDSVADLSIVFRSSDESVATVSQDGTVHAIKVGSALISAVPSIGFKYYDAEASVLVNVIPEIIKATSINVVNTTPSDDGRLFVTDEIQLKAEILPANHTYDRIFWSSSDESIVTVDQNGLAILHKVGTAYVYANSTDRSNVRGEYKVEVNAFVDAVSVSIEEPEPMCLTAGDVRLNVTYNPTGATIGSVTWTSEDPEIVTVHRGIVTPVGFGTTNVKATCSNGESASVSVTVIPGWYFWDSTNSWKGWSTSDDNGLSDKGAERWKIQMNPSPEKWRRDFKYTCSNDKPMVMYLKEYPIFAVRMTTVNGCNSKLDAADISAGGAGDPNPKSGIDLGDGTSLLLYNLATRPNFKELTVANFRVFQVKLADVAPENYTAETAYYDILWLGTFRSEDEAKQFAADQVAAGK